MTVYKLIAKDTIEERILNLQRSKTDLAQRFVDSASSATGRSMAALTKDDLLALLAEGFSPRNSQFVADYHRWLGCS